MEYAVWQSVDEDSRNVSLLQKLHYQLENDSNVNGVLQTFDRISWHKFDQVRKSRYLKNRSLFYFNHQEWNEAANYYYRYIDVKGYSEQVDIWFLYYLNSLAKGNLIFSSDSLLFHYPDSSLMVCLDCLETMLSPIKLPPHLRVANVLLPGSGLMAIQSWKLGSTSLLLNVMGFGGGYLMLTAQMPLNAIFWTGAWEILFHAGSQRLLRREFSAKEQKKTAGLSSSCEARWIGLLGGLEYDLAI